MLPLIVITAVALVIVLVNAEQKPKNPWEKQVIRLLLSSFIALSILALLLENRLPSALQLAAATFIGCLLIIRTLMARFWGKVVYQSLLMLLLFWCGYLYSATQLPYDDKPFSWLSNNQPKPLQASDVQHQWLLGLPLVRPAADNPTQHATIKIAVPAKPNEAALNWEALWPLMEKDARIRQQLQALREQQQQDHTAFTNQLNATSVSSTAMRRHALGREHLDDLLQEHAISDARYKTLQETWRLLDSDEQAFKQRQAEARFHSLLELLEDHHVDESNKITLIDFMVRHFAGDIRLFKPLLAIYDGLDHEYPRLKRLNQDYLGLYLAKREAVIRGFRAMGQAVMQPLLDYRHKVLPTLRYSYARLDDFLSNECGLQAPSLYQTAPAQTVADFLNRKKYPGLDWFSGAAFSEEYARKTLQQMMSVNAAPSADAIVLGLPAVQHQAIVQALSARYTPQIDQLLIDTDPAVRANLAWQLAVLKKPHLMPLLLELMRDQNPEVRRIAAIAIGNFSIRDTQASSDPKFTEIVRMLQNYRSNSDAFGRAWAVAALANVADKQKALYVIDLLLSDGVASQSVVGNAAETLHEDEKQVIADLTATLQQTPEELLIKTQALQTLLALESPEALELLLHDLEHRYAVTNSRPSMLRYLVPHITLPQEAENIEDVVFYLAQTQGNGHPQFHKRQLKALHDSLRQAYQHHRSGEFFQLMQFLRLFDPHEYQQYLAQTHEQIRIMRAIEYLTATVPFWLVLWPITVLIALLVSYLLLPALKWEPVRVGHNANARANPAAFGSVVNHKAPSIVPITIANLSGDDHAHQHG